MWIIAKTGVYLVKGIAVALKEPGIKQDLCFICSDEVAGTGNCADSA